MRYAPYTDCSTSVCLNINFKSVASCLTYTAKIRVVGNLWGRKCFLIVTVNVIRRVQVIQDGWKLNGTHQLLVYGDDVNILGRSVPTIKENAVSLVVASQEIGLEVNTDKTECMVMSRDQNVGRSHSMKFDNSS